MEWLWILIIGLVVAYVVFIVWLKTFRKAGLAESDRKFLMRKWQEIKKDTDMRHQIINADKILDKLLEKRGYSGNVGEKLKQGKAHFSDLDGIWNAHKLRNKLAHELDFKLSSSMAQSALRSFEKGFKDLGLGKE
ncbi:MAG: hypothetical protein ACRCZE_00820 [Candidatus Altimarinota bacterium]